MSDSFFTSETPEKLGISSRSIVSFIERLWQDKINMHGFILLRKGKVAAEAYWKPFSKDHLHRMYSVSKSFVSLAIGLMIDEGKLSLEDPVHIFFSDKLPENLHPYLKQTTVRDLLIMASPHHATTYDKNDPDWLKTFFHTEPTHRPGMLFQYNTAATVTLNAIIERISGMPFLNYMRKKLLQPIGFSEDAWCIQTPEGYSWGGSGVLCTLRDMAKLAYLCMNHGKWMNKQLISKKYMQEATSKQIDNSLINELGYGYQIWMEKYNGFSFRGMGGQLALCFPEKDVLFACLSDTQIDDPLAKQLIKKSFYQTIFTNLKNRPLVSQLTTNRKLEKMINNLSIQPLTGSFSTPYINKVHNKWYNLLDNPMQIKKMRLSFSQNQGVFEYENHTGRKQISFGFGKQIAGIFPEKHYFSKKIGIRANRGYSCLSSGAWVESNKLNVLIHITDYYLGTVKITFSFKGDTVSLQMIKAAEWFLEKYEGFASGSLD